ncbi:DUF3775 domain-containing protein [uncultured Sphingomonas sp.]|uniref:DUF3775 domain-containing protein n=1 Tax=uncultured Sphingomonas sp. TaxID=158754 RepID=UPI0025F4F5EC|nr:DUF3775 domain-containing protein [uncultured Sphingomonas sp.]
MDLSTPLETICRLIVRARELEAQVPAIETDEEKDPTDSDDEFAVLEDEANEAIEEEIEALLDDLGDDQLQEVLALALVGRGTYDASEWDDAIEAAADPDAEDPADQLLDMPTLAAYLEAGLAAFDLSCEGMGQID